MKIVVTDGHSTNPGDLSWDVLKEFGEVEVYDHPKITFEETLARIGDADCVFHSKVDLTREILDRCPNLKFIGFMATGYDNLDLEAAKEKGIAVYYTPAYSTDAVSQHAIALLLAITNKVYENNELAKDGKWVNRSGFDYGWAPVTLLDGKSIGIVGYGNIGKRVAKIAEAMGMKVNIYSRDKEACMKSDVISLHCPANADTYHMVNREFIDDMKDGAILINTARGSLIDEEALKDALLSGKISACGLDVLEEEPPTDSPLIGLSNCYITPHVAWIPKDTRQKIIDIAYDNLKSFIEGRDNGNRLV